MTVSRVNGGEVEQMWDDGANLGYLHNGLVSSVKGKFDERELSQGRCESVKIDKVHI